MDRVETTTWGTEIAEFLNELCSVVCERQGIDNDALALSNFKDSFLFTHKKEKSKNTRRVAGNKGEGSQFVNEKCIQLQVQFTTLAAHSCILNQLKAQMQYGNDRYAICSILGESCETIMRKEGSMCCYRRDLSFSINLCTEALPQFSCDKKS